MKNSDKKNKILFNLAIIIFLIICLLIKLPSSPLKSGNTWDDTNAMLRIGQLWQSGVIPFRDVFEQRGIVLYFIYLIANLISSHGYFGLFVIETVNFIFIQQITKKIFDQAIGEKKYNLNSILSLMMILVMIGNYSFKNGGSPEEFTLGWILLASYCFLKVLKESKNFYFILFGICLAITINIKYSLIGPFIAIIIIYILDLSKKKQLNKKNFLKIMKNVVLGLIIVGLPITIYLLVTRSFNALIDIYFIKNIQGYTAESAQNLDFFQHIITSLAIGITQIINRNCILLLLFTISIGSIKNLKIEMEIFLSFLVTIIVSYWSLYPMDYMLLIVIYGMYIIIILSVLKRLKKIDKKIILLSLFITAVIGFNLSKNNPSLTLSRFGNPNDSVIGYNFAKSMKINGGPQTLIYYDSLDFGIERFTKVTSKYRFFERTNIKLKEKDRSLSNLIKNKKVEYVVVNRDSLKKKDIKNNYQKVSHGKLKKYTFDNNFKAHKKIVDLFLLKRKI